MNIIKMTFSELEKYIFSKSRRTIIYTTENNEDDNLRIQIRFNDVYFDHYNFNRIVFFDTNYGTAKSGNYLSVFDVTTITVEHILDSSDCITIKCTSNGIDRTLVFVFDY